MVYKTTALPVELRQQKVGAEMGHLLMDFDGLPSPSMSQLKRFTFPGMMKMLCPHGESNPSFSLERDKAYIDYQSFSSQGAL